MSNRAIVQRDLYQDSHGGNSEEDTELHLDKPKSDAGMPRDAITHSIKYTLPMEPTESLDKTRDYPPIVTVDGRVDTDIDHLMENPEEDYQDLPAQDIPSTFPKPHVVRVIDGSLDDDIDNLMNHDGTMAHTLVDAPKHFNRSDLKEINSNKSGKKYPARAQGQKNRSFNKMSQEHSDEELPFSSGSEIVPYYDGNNSSNLVMEVLDLDLVQQPQQTTHNDILPAETTATDEDVMMVADVTGQENDDTSTSEQVKTSDKMNELQKSKEKSEDEPPDVSVVLNPLETVEEEKIVTSGGTVNDVNSNSESMTQSPVEKQFNEIKLKDDISQIVHQFLANMSQEDLVRRLSCEGSQTYEVNSTEEKQQEEVAVTAKKSSDQVVDYSAESSESQQSFIDLRSVCEQSAIKNVPKDAERDKLLGGFVDVVKSDTPLQDTISILKKTFEDVLKDSNETNSKRDSQKMLAVTALKVAGESMTAAAKMADALTLLVKNSQPLSSLLVGDKMSVDSNSQRYCNLTSSNPNVAPVGVQEPPPARSLVTDCQSVNKPSKEILKPKGNCDEENSKKLETVSENPDGTETEVNESTYREESKGKSKQQGNESAPKFQDDVEDDDTHCEKKAHGVKNMGRYEMYQMYEKTLHSPPDNVVKSQRRRQADSESKERHKRSSRKREDDFEQDDEVKLEKYCELSKGQRRDMKDKKKHESDRHKKTRKSEVNDGNGMDYQDNWKGYDVKRDMVHCQMKRYDKQMVYRVEREGRPPSVDDNTIESNTRSKSQKDRKHKSRTRRQSTDVNESRSPRCYDGVGHSEPPMHRLEGDNYRRVTTSNKSTMQQKASEVFEKSEPWTFPESEQIQGERYFDQVVRRLKPYSPPRGSMLPDPTKEYIRAKLVGSCVDPYARDSDFDSIEFNGNAQLSESRLAQCEDDNDLHSDEDNCSSNGAPSSQFGQRIRV